MTLSSLLLLWLTGSVWSAEAPKLLRVSAIPDENPTELQRKYQPLAEYISQEVGLPVKYVPVVDYAATVEGLAANKLDLVWYGGFTSVQAVRRTGGTATRLVMRKEDKKFRSVFITRKGSGIQTLQDLEGRTFAFGSESSTSGHLMPRHFLLEHGITPESAFSRFSFSGAHDATAAWVEAGKVDAGALSISVWEKLVRTKKVNTDQVIVFWTTPPYVDYVWTARGGLPQALKEKITAAFLQLDYQNREHRMIMDLQRTKQYARAKDEWWNGIEEAAKAASLIRE
ncbi:MAG: putative selenate ABC transporter substrate-binding protein [Candidatus Methylomirabilales bacterium]